MKGHDEVKRLFTGTKVDTKTFGQITEFSKHFLSLALKIQREAPEGKPKELSLWMLLGVKLLLTHGLTHQKPKS